MEKEEERLIGLPGEKAPGEDQRCDGGGGDLEDVTAGWLVGHGVLFSVRGLQIEGGTEPPPSSRLSPSLRDHRACRSVGGHQRGKLPSALRDEEETLELLQGNPRKASRTSHSGRMA